MEEGFHGFEFPSPVDQGKEPSLSLLTCTVEYQSMAMIPYDDYSLIRARSGEADTPAIQCSHSVNEEYW